MASSSSLAITMGLVNQYGNGPETIITFKFKNMSDFKHIITQEDLDNHPGLDQHAQVGDEITMPVDELAGVFGIKPKSDENVDEVNPEVALEPEDEKESDSESAPDSEADGSEPALESNIPEEEQELPVVDEQVMPTEEKESVIKRNGYSLYFVKADDTIFLNELYATGKSIGEIHVTTQDQSNDKTDEIIIALKD